MPKRDWLHMLALGLATVLFLGIPYALYRTGAVALNHPTGVLQTSLWLWSLLALRLLISDAAERDFRFVDHGLDLAVLGLAGLLTLLGAQQLQVSSLTRLSNNQLLIAAVVALVITLLTARIAARTRTAQTTSAALLRGLNYMLGAFTFEAFVTITASPGF